MQFVWSVQLDIRLLLYGERICPVSTHASVVSKPFIVGPYWETCEPCYAYVAIYPSRSHDSYTSAVLQVKETKVFTDHQTTTHKSAF